MQPLQLSNERTILIVDDCQVYASATKEMLQRMGVGYKAIHCATTSKETIALCEKNDYQLILLDYNLGEQADGRQILERLRSEGLISLDCIVVVVTADNSAQVVRSFLELEPDGYLVKPVSYDILKNRLPALINRKQTIGASLKLFNSGHFQQAIAEAQLVKNNAQELTAQSSLIQAKSLIALNELDSARNLLVSMQSGPDKPKVALELSKVHQLQNQYSLAMAALENFENHPIYSASIAQRQAEILFAQKMYSEALEKISIATSLTPENLDRQLLRAQFAIADFQFEPALQALELVLRLIPSHDERLLSIRQKYCQILADYAYFVGPNSLDDVARKIKAQSDVWRKECEVNDYKPFELLIFSRVQAMYGNVGKAANLYQRFYDEYAEQTAQQSDLFLRLEVAKTSAILNLFKKFEDDIEAIVSQLQLRPRTIENDVFEVYIAKWRFQLEQNIHTSEKLLSEAKKEIKKGSIDTAIEKLLAALDKHKANSDIPHLVIFCLTKVWPEGWSKHDVKRLSQSCVEQLRNTRVFKNKAFQHYCVQISQTTGTDLLNFTGEA